MSYALIYTPDIDALMLGNFEIIVFDAVPQSTHRRSVDISSHPVEEGSEVSDNMRAEPRELDLVGVASNYPASMISWAKRSYKYLTSINNNYAKDLYKTLNEWMDNGYLLTVLAVDDWYENMAITSMERGHDHTKGNAVHVSLSLREVRVVSTASTQAPEPTTTRAEPKKSKGTKAVKPKEATQDDEGFLEFLGGVAGKALGG